jgi:DNA-binding transcriptional MerR regulator
MVADKSPDAFRTISEVAEELDLPQHVLRFWETRFTQIKPLKRGGGRRLYRSDDIDLLRGIRHLLYGEGYTIRGVQRILKEQGLRFVQTIWRDGVPSLEMPNAERAPKRPLQSRVGPKGVSAAMLSTRDDDHDDQDDLARFSADQDAEFDTSEIDFDTSSSLGRDLTVAPLSPVEAPALPMAPPASAFPASATVASAPPAIAAPASPGKVAPLTSSERAAPVEAFAPARAQSANAVNEVGLAATGTHGAPLPSRAVVRPEPALPRGVLPGASPEPDRQGSTFSFIDRLRGNAPRGSEPAETASGGGRPSGQLSRDDVRKLQSILFELLECKRVLDQTR